MLPLHSPVPAPAVGEASQSFGTPPSCLDHGRIRRGCQIVGLFERPATRHRALKLIVERSSRDLAPYRRQHPFLGSLNLCEWMRMLAYHEVRHTKQIREIGKSFQR